MFQGFVFFFFYHILPFSRVSPRKGLDAQRRKAEEDGLFEGRGTWDLMPVEKLQLLDARPSSAAEIYLVQNRNLIYDCMHITIFSHFDCV